MLNAIKKHEHVLFSILLILADFVIIVVSLFSSYYVRFYTIFDVPKGVPDIDAYLRLIVAVSLLYMIVFERIGLYKPKIDPFHLGEIKMLIKGVLLGGLFVMASTFLYRQFEYSRGVILIGLATMTIGLISEKIMIRLFQAYWRSKGLLMKKVLIVGTGKSATRYYRVVKSKTALGFCPVGFLCLSDKKIMDNFTYKDKLLGTTDDIAKVIRQYSVDEVIIALPSASHTEIVDIITQCEKEIVNFRIMPDIFEIMINKMTIDEIDGIHFVGIKETPLLSWRYFIKRGFDIVCAGLGLILLSPLFLVIAILVKKDSPGPIFYKQERMGLDGKIFTMYKFRTMTIGAERETGPVWATTDDKRKTKIGDFLRRKNLDELPQIYNVFIGNMSLVGPRPERPFFVDKFKHSIPHYMSRHRVKAGITGWAQVNGFRGNTSLSGRIKYDLYYIEHWSLLFDIKIILMTFFAHKNAY